MGKEGVELSRLRAVVTIRRRQSRMTLEILVAVRTNLPGTFTTFIDWIYALSTGRGWKSDDMCTREIYVSLV